MRSVFGPSSKNLKQAKTKDQNLKAKYFVKAAKKSDLLDISYKKLAEYVKKNKKLLQRCPNKKS